MTRWMRLVPVDPADLSTVSGPECQWLFDNDGSDLVGLVNLGFVKIQTWVIFRVWLFDIYCSD